MASKARKRVNAAMREREALAAKYANAASQLTGQPLTYKPLTAAARRAANAQLGLFNNVHEKTN
jgi:hypothetical protein